MLTKQWVSGKCIAEGEDFDMYEVRCPFCGKEVSLTMDFDGVVVVDRGTLCAHYSGEYDYCDDDNVGLLFVSSDDQDD